MLGRMEPWRISAKTFGSSQCRLFKTFFLQRIYNFERYGWKLITRVTLFKAWSVWWYWIIFKEKLKHSNILLHNGSNKTGWQFLDTMFITFFVKWNYICFFPIIWDYPFTMQDLNIRFFHPWKDRKILICRGYIEFPNNIIIFDCCPFFVQ